MSQRFSELRVIQAELGARGRAAVPLKMSGDGRCLRVESVTYKFPPLKMSGLRPFARAGQDGYFPQRDFAGLCALLWLGEIQRSSHNQVA